MRLVFIITVFLAFQVAAFTATLDVPGTYRTIQDAINAAVNGDTVLVAPGTYGENISFKGKAILVTSSDGPEATTIDGQSLGSVVLFNTNEGSESILDGFFITNGTGTVDYPSYFITGGGIYCYKTSPTIRNNIISANKAQIGGGIGCTWGGAPAILGNTISENTAIGHNLSSGGAIVCSQYVNALISGNLMLGNQAVGTGHPVDPSCGGAIAVAYNSNCTITNNVIMGNKAEYGGGILCGGDANTYAFIANNVVAMNTAEGGNKGDGSAGGGIDIAEDGKATVCGNLLYGNKAKIGGGCGCHLGGDTVFTNNTVHGNEATLWGGGVSCNVNSTLLAMNNIVWDNSSPASSGPEIQVGPNSVASIDYSDVKGGQAAAMVDPLGTLNWGANNLDKDPLFVATAEADFHIKYTSPCRDAGDTGSVPVDLLEDFEGDARICYGTVDMGCDEFYTHLYCTGDLTPGGAVALKFVGTPGAAQVGLIIGFGVFDPPLPGAYGDWYIKPPMVMLPSLPAIPADGILVLPGTLPGSPPGPYTIYTQAMIGYQLTNLCIMTVE